FAVLFEDNFNYLSKMCLLRMREAAFTMIRMARERGYPVIVCGADASDHPGDYLNHGADYILIGEGEQTLAELLSALEAGRRPELDPESAPAGLAWRSSDREDKVFRTPRRPDIKDLDRLPFPAWDLVDVEKYRAVWLDRHGYFSMNMVTTRGCPYHCNWCAKPIWGQRYNSRSPDNVVQEMVWLKDTFQPDHIWFADDIFGLKPGWIPKFASLVQKSGSIMPFKCLSRVDLLLREGEIEALKVAGAEIVWVGAESGAQKILTAMEKGTRVEQIYTASRELRRAGVQVGFFLQFGYPGETREDIETTLQMVREIMPDDIGMSVSYPLPGTTFYNRVVGELGEKKNWYDSSDMAMMYEGPYKTDFYRQLHIVLHKEFRMRVHWQRLKVTAGHPARLSRSDLRNSAAIAYHWITLPLARRKLDRLEQRSSDSVGPLGPGMSLEEASRPTPQN
ncbi:MAG: radical SAM protein, partial [Anaerolineales bacterium]|nr:radical SAM protein [Anaerolineales bacterium]